MLVRGADPDIANSSGLRCADLKLSWQIKDEPKTPMPIRTSTLPSVSS